MATMQIFVELLKRLALYRVPFCIVA